jgi:hypothetical protein
MTVSVPALRVGDVVDFEYTLTREDVKEVRNASFSGRVLTVETMHDGGWFRISFEGAYLTLNKHDGEWSVYNSSSSTFTTKVTKFKKL